MGIFLNQLIQCCWNKIINLRPVDSMHYVMLYPQNGNRIVTVDLIMWRHFTLCIK